MNRFSTAPLPDFINCRTQSESEKPFNWKLASSLIISVCPTFGAYLGFNFYSCSIELTQLLRKVSFFNRSRKTSSSGPSRIGREALFASSSSRSMGGRFVSAVSSGRKFNSDRKSIITPPKEGFLAVLGMRAVRSITLKKSSNWMIRIPGSSDILDAA